MKIHLIFGTWLITLGAICCQSQNKNVQELEYSSFPYNLNERVEYVLPKELKEISGLAFLGQNENIIYAIQDEEGRLFGYDLFKKKIVQKNAFALNGDYEELATNNDFFYVLKSNGHIYSFSVEHMLTSENVIVHKDLVPKGEYESMAIDTLSDNLILLCKVCNKDRNSKTVSGYLIKIGDGGRLSKGKHFSLQLEVLSARDKRINNLFKPSAIARKESTKEWYILSSINRSLVITDDSFKAKEIILLPRQTFEQPEGIGFDINDNMYISSEAGQQSYGMIYKFNVLR